mmetsp:Transcript_21471/g.34393  ORF Transcript_21471/g.34393 Transcript_21471/m.34393 type:complete len:84 (+) Transcript_21471:309-560(+)
MFLETHHPTSEQFDQSVFHFLISEVRFHLRATGLSAASDVSKVATFNQDCRQTLKYNPRTELQRSSQVSCLLYAIETRKACDL